ncbi:GNAT family N-acetyltransferase [Fulvivirga sp. 29W222]|uniref:GNAT family N-acetyltransferase n=1 Tax=Fulvivirga marina TaxID=2494733 RepID=A0A937G035_9BACT|nr:GNAT family N-acetyltransferase [Fulvivirga marina]MBL6449234.1 GNAT family N-acetyltransferase [Fulvivirga marina]
MMQSGGAMNAKIEIKQALGEHHMKQVYMIRKVVFTDEQGISEELDNDGKDPDATNLLLYVDGVVAGTGRVVFEDNKAILARIAVLPDFRGKGYAKLIINELEKHGLSHGVKEFDLYPHSYLKRFYESVGYLQAEEKVYEVAGHQLIKMSKRV